MVVMFLVIIRHSYPELLATNSSAGKIIG